MNSEVLRAGGLIIFRRIELGIQYLLLQTSYGVHHWTPPKGHLDPGEDYRTAALRETEEEAGYTSNQLTVTDFKSTLNYIVKNRPKEVVYWLAELKDPTDGVKLSNEHQDFKWCNLEEACHLSGYSDMEKVLRDADNYLHS
ncbi:bis(5'-nucleosyl)-tetraphosphatase [asymmetrical]-like [Lytechinus variegatus]|uniref:bis(5'-nucleosyl)-tetraphosphatase [asymmetrical]-like n=1 Tax=Lytechinus variegatus TaxID=7654 RepID=UPI001BB1B88A|nr:bis(5'-nucleosyl)-tetraphosphatase [asymmetrical]-like [Lytechinus variegatus]XP_041465561.1 bis(5'-nucleosyl)-tetraphosphatase [asymmetrical]-like [Lytechinus variegatus]